MGQERGLDGQAGKFPLSDRFAEIGDIPVNDASGEQVELVLALVRQVESGRALQMLRLGMFHLSVIRSFRRARCCPLRGAFSGRRRPPLSVRFCPLPESPRSFGNSWRKNGGGNCNVSPLLLTWPAVNCGILVTLGPYVGGSRRDSMVLPLRVVWRTNRRSSAVDCTRWIRCLL